MDNQSRIGASGDFGEARFTQDSQEAAFTADRGAIGTGEFDARHRRQDPQRATTACSSRDTLSPRPALDADPSGRYNRARVRIDDRSGDAPELNGDHRFSRFNPALGLNFNPSEQLTAYATYNEGMRGADGDRTHLRRPGSAMQAAQQLPRRPAAEEGGGEDRRSRRARQAGPRLSWSAAVYPHRPRRRHPVHQQRRRGINAGYFQNVGKTRRQGLELGAEQRAAAASRERPLRLHRRDLPSRLRREQPGQHLVRRRHRRHPGAAGDRIPGIPRHSLKLRLEYDLTEQWTVGANVHSTAAASTRAATRTTGRARQGAGLHRAQPRRPLHDTQRDWDLRPRQQPVRPGVRQLRRAGRELLHRPQQLRPCRRQPGGRAVPRLRRAAGHLDRGALCLRSGQIHPHSRRFSDWQRAAGLCATATVSRFSLCTGCGAPPIIGHMGRDSIPTPSFRTARRNEL